MLSASTQYGSANSSNSSSDLSNGGASHSSAAMDILAKRKPHLSIGKAPSNTRQEQDMCSIGSGPKNNVLAVTSIDANNGSVAGLTNHAHHYPSDAVGYQRQCLTQQALADHQVQFSQSQDDRAEPTLAARRIQREPLEAAAYTIGFNLPASAMGSFTGMAPLERYKAERDNGKGPWTAMTHCR